MYKNLYKPQIKICGITDIDQAVKIADLGVDAIGFVFYPASKRNIAPDKAKKIIQRLPLDICNVGVFVNESFDFIMDKQKYCNLDAVQLHGNESEELVLKLKKKGLNVIKALYLNDSPSICDAKKYSASSYLIEHCKGKLPGGNALDWDWEKARDFGNNFAFILAGGLNSDNIQNAFKSSIPDAIDVSSGVEIKKGVKDIVKVKDFLLNLENCVANIDFNKTRNLRKVF